MMGCATYQSDLLVGMVLLKKTCQPGGPCKIPGVAVEHLCLESIHTQLAIWR